MSRVFLRFAGGKRRMMKLFYDAHFPTFEAGADNHFIDPMCGGGAMPLDWNERWQGRVHMGDVNTDLVQVYNFIKYQTMIVASCVARLAERYVRLPDEAARAVFYAELKAQYNFTPQGARKPSGARVTTASEAAGFIALNRMCFNGLHRENSNGEFDVPFGRQKALPRHLYARVITAGKALERAMLWLGDFSWVLQVARPGDLVYFDPPFDGTFDKYVSRVFGPNDQARLAATVQELVARGVTVRVANSDTPLIRQLYSGFEMVVFASPQSINSDGTGRGPQPELLIKG